MLLTTCGGPPVAARAEPLVYRPSSAPTRSAGVMPRAARMAKRVRADAAPAPNEPRLAWPSPRRQGRRSPRRGCSRPSGRERVGSKVHLHGGPMPRGARRRRPAQDPGRPVRRGHGLDYLTVPVLAPRLTCGSPSPTARCSCCRAGAALPRRAVRGETHLDIVAPGEEFEVQLAWTTRSSRAEAAPSHHEQGPDRRHQDHRHRLRDHGGQPSRAHGHGERARSIRSPPTVTSRSAPREPPPPAETDDLGELTWNLP